MDNRKKNTLWVIYFIAFLIISACTRNEDINPVDDQSSGIPDIGINADNIPQWIFDEMSFFYFWNKELPNEDPLGNENPKTYFNGLVNSTDIFSYITDDAAAIKEEMSGTIMAMGFSPTFGVFTNTNKLFAIVEYVYQNSPAEKAGLKRGDIILKLNGTDLSQNNYLDLTSKNGFSVTLGSFNGRSIVETNKTISISTGVIELNPVIHYEVKTVNNIKVGYLVFVDFISGDNDKWLKSLGNALGDMKAQGISQLILDLRYNPGGEVSVAEYLSSALAPARVAVNRETLVSFQYNENLQEYYRRRQGQNSPNLISRFFQNENNLNLNEIIFLTTGNTASASELVINGLKPHMKVTIIGEPTFGKFYGSFAIYDESEPPVHNWAIAPIVLKYANANGVTDFVNGLSPDIFIEDDLLNAKSFGDERDPMIAAALSIIKGELLNFSSARMEVKKPYKAIYDLNKINRKNVFFSTEITFLE